MADEPDIRIDKEPYLVPNVSVSWQETGDGVYELSFSGTHTVTLTEVVTGDGIVYESPAFRGKKTGELKDALRAAFVNSMNAAFLAEWRRQHPPTTVTKTTLEYENARLKAELEELQALMAENSGTPAKKRA